MKCFYHKSDLDGHCSGAIIKQVHPECEMIGVGYNNTILPADIKSNERIFVVDFSFPREVMGELHGATRLTWIDHHESAIRKCEASET